MTTDTELSTRETWLAERRTGIGGSDAAAACGLSKWKTRYRLWLEKLGRTETPETERMRWGTKLEPIVRQEYSNRTGRTLVTPNAILRHPKHHFALANVDGIVEGELRGYEGKTARTAEGWGEPGSDDIPIEYGAQVQHYMAVTGLAVFDVAVLIGGSDFRIYEVPADYQVQEIILDQEREFWRLVETETEPEVESPEDTRARWPKSTAGRNVVASSEIEEMATALAVSKAAASRYEDSTEYLAAQIQKFMGDAEGLQTPDGRILATWKSPKPSNRFDMDAFKAEHPDLYKAFLRTGEGSRRFLLKEQTA